MDNTSIVIKTLALWGGITIAVPTVDITSFVCAFLGGAAFVTYSTVDRTRWQTCIYFATSSIVGYLISGEIAEYFSFPYRNTMAFLCGTLCLVTVASIHKYIKGKLER